MSSKIISILKKPYSKWIAPLFFPGSKEYWERRYVKGENSGRGSYGELAEYKAEIINNFVAENGLQTVIEFGCGDGNQLSLGKYPNYIGYDVSLTAIEICRKKFSNNSHYQFELLEKYSGEKADLTMSLDVIYHLVEDHIYEDHLEKLFSASNRFVIIYSINNEDFQKSVSHIKSRKFTDWISQNKSDWSLEKQIPNKFTYNDREETGSPADFYFYKRNTIS
jgi:hypothetical protein